MMQMPRHVIWALVGFVLVEDAFRWHCGSSLVGLVPGAAAQAPPSPMSNQQNLPPENDKGGTLSGGALAGVVAGTVGGTMIIVAVILFMLRHLANKKARQAALRLATVIEVKDKAAEGLPMAGRDQQGPPSPTVETAPDHVRIEVKPSLPRSQDVSLHSSQVTRQLTRSHSQFDPAPDTGLSWLDITHNQFKRASNNTDMGSVSSWGARPDPVRLRQRGALAPGDPFLRNVAPYFRWIETIPTDGLAVEHDIEYKEDPNAPQTLDVPAPVDKLNGEVVRLSYAELSDQVELVAEGFLGKGSAAYVLQCRWPSRFGPHALLAAKIVRDPYDPQGHLLASFEYEADVLSRIKHPNIVRLYGYCLEPPCVCLIMELLPSTLSDLLHCHPKRFGKTPDTPSYKWPSLWRRTIQRIPGPQTDARLMAAGLLRPETPPERGAGEPEGPDTATAPKPRVSPIAWPTCILDVLNVSRDIAAGLARLHTKADPDSLADLPLEKQRMLVRVVHRDLKPANILVNSLGVAKISDFGLAREQEGSGLQTDHAGAGTLRWMAPELLIDPEHRLRLRITHKVDIYSLGITMWQLVSKALPWEGLSENVLPSLVTNGQRPSVKAFPTQTQPAADDNTRVSASLDNAKLSAANLTTSAAIAVSHNVINVAPRMSAQLVRAYAESTYSGEFSMTTSNMVMPPALHAATFQNMPQYTALLTSCWNSDPRHRPEASVILEVLEQLAVEYKAQLESAITETAE